MTIHILKILIIAVCVSGTYTVFARTITTPDSGSMIPDRELMQDDVLEAFTHVKALAPVNVTVPSVVEVPLGSDVSGKNTFAVYEESSNRFIPYHIEETYVKNPARVDAYSGNVNDYMLTDGVLDNGIDYFLTETQTSVATIVLTTDVPIESSSFILELDQYVALPTQVSLTARVDGIDRMIVAPLQPASKIVTFPKTTSDRWTITLGYSQPLRINEVRLIEDAVEQNATRGIRFLAQPLSSYRIYHNPDRMVSIQTIERGNLRDDTNVLSLPEIPSTYNQMYRQADIDGDGVVDLRDNCVQIVNADQIDVDRNGRGDVCDDYDRDGVIQLNDNCPNHANREQTDTDGDGIGDICDEEESRFTEKYPWVPWAGMGIAALVLGVLFLLVASAPKNTDVGTDTMS